MGRLAQLLYQSVSKIAVTDGDFYFDEFVVAQRSVNLCEHVCAQAITPNTHDGVELMRNGPVLPEHSVAQLGFWGFALAFHRGHLYSGPYSVRQTVMRVPHLWLRNVLRVAHG